MGEESASIKIKYKLQKNYVILIYDKKVPTHIWRIATVTWLLPSRDSDTKRSDSEN